MVKSHHILDKVLRALEENGFLTVEVTKIGPPIYTITLTDRGKAVAEQLKRAEEAAKGAIIFEEEGRIEVKVPEEWREKWKNLHALFHVNVYEDHVTIMETNHEGTGRERIFNIYIRENGQGHLRLWCEEDESFDCYHVGYALTLAAVQDMFARVRGGK
ncbi:hypothetical protein B2A_14067 [mine drainage metagenome]|uniref:Uncharacterized protein n=1 Tax=mine drainage metagenome TaxID=410659 RepID=T0YBY5_9ZZZZ